MRAHHAIHGREIAKMLKAPPQDFSSRLITATSTDKPAELPNPMDRFTQRRWLVRRDCDTMNGTIECLSFIRLQQHAARRGESSDVTAGTERAGMVASSIRHAKTLSRARQRLRRSAVANCRASRRQPLFKIRCHSSTP